VQDDVLFVDRRGRQAGVQAVSVEAPEVHGVEILKLDAPECGLDVRTDCVLVPLEGAPAYRGLYILQSPIEIVADC